MKTKICIVMLLCILSCDHTDDPIVLPSAATSDTGNVIFWTSNLAAHGGFVIVTINGIEKQIVANYQIQPTTCLSTTGCAFFNLGSGDYEYSTKDYFGFTSAGKVTVTKNACNKKYIE